MIDTAIEKRLTIIQSSVDELQNKSNIRDIDIETLKGRVDGVETSVKALDIKNDKSFDRVYEKLDKINDNILELFKSERNSK